MKYIKNKSIQIELGLVSLVLGGLIYKSGQVSNVLTRINYDKLVKIENVKEQLNRAQNITEAQRVLLENKIAESNKLLSILSEEMQSYTDSMNKTPDSTHTSEVLNEMNDKYWKAVEEAHVQLKNKHEEIADYFINVSSPAQAHFNGEWTSYSNSSFHFTDKISNLLETINSYFNSLTHEQLGAALHLIGFYVIFLASTNIIMILYGDYLINRFKIENRFPKLVGLINLRKKVKHYSISMNFAVIFFVILYLGYLDIGTLFNYF